MLKFNRNQLFNTANGGDRVSLAPTLNTPLIECSIETFCNKIDAIGYSVCGLTFRSRFNNIPQSDDDFPLTIITVKLISNVVASIYI